LIRPALIVALMAAAAPAAAASLCARGETPLFFCPIGRKFVSVCGQAAGRATYRYGRPGRTELEVNDGVRRASHGFSGGGEDQLWVDRGGYRYVVYSRTMRTAFGASGRHDPGFSAGLIVLKGEKIVSEHACGAGGGQTIGSAARALPEGAWTEH